MIDKIDGVCFKNMVDYAVRNLNKHVNFVNQLNVFPVPDGDTGTNMVMTIHKGLLAIDEAVLDLPSVSKKFARSVVFEARGNSGVIVSQFLKGISEQFFDAETADGKLLIAALERGVQYAYSSVANPVEGTMLTVVNDATQAVKKVFSPDQSIGEIIDSFIRNAKVSLENTPELLPVLKESGVVDSGGAGIVYLFEGIKKYLDGEPLAAIDDADETCGVDYDAFGRNSSFEFGYCTELLLQLLNGKQTFDYDEFKAKIALLGNSLVLSCENDKVRIHIHTQYPEKVFAFCHQYGEFLSSKIENMTVQHTEIAKRIICAEEKSKGAFSVVAVAGDPQIQKLFIEMGADVVIYSVETVSTKDYLEAFDLSEAENIILFPNSSDAVLSAIQAKKLYQKARVIVLNSRSIADCYAALPTVDFEETDIEKVVDSVNEVFNNLYIASITKRNSTVHYMDKNIKRDEYYSFSGKELVAISRGLEETVVQTVCKITKQQCREIITIFFQPKIEEQMESIVESIKRRGIDAEIFLVPAESLPCMVTISFE